MAVKKFNPDLKWPMPVTKIADIPVLVSSPEGKTVKFWHLNSDDKITFGLVKNPLIKGKNAIGMELEVKFGFDPQRVISIRNWAMMNLILNRNHENRDKTKRLVKLESAGDVHPFYRDAIADNTSPFVMQPPHDDDGCVEHVFSPVSLAALDIAKYEIQKVCYYAEIFGAIERAPGAGIHLSADRTLFGLTGPGESETVANWLVWLYLNKDFMIQFSYRDDYNKLRASIDHFLGDNLQRLSPMEKIYQLKTKKADILDALNPKPGTASTTTSGSYNGPWGYSNPLNQHMPTLYNGSISSAAIGSAFNIKWNNDNRGIHEFRWLASTLDYRRIITWYEWYFAIIEFCRTKFEVTLNQITQISFVDNSMKDFCTFVKENKKMYKYLHNHLAEDTYSKDFMLGSEKEEPLEFTDEQVVAEDFYSKTLKEALATKKPITSVNSLQDLTLITALSEVNTPAVTHPNVETPELPTQESTTTTSPSVILASSIPEEEGDRAWLEALALAIPAEDNGSGYDENEDYDDDDW